MNPCDAEEAVLVEAMDTAMRGPRRNGLYAVWILIRMCGDMMPPFGVAPRNHRLRLDDFEHRISSLSLPAPLRRAIVAALRHLDPPSPDGAHLALRQMVAPVAETLGPGPADAVARAAALMKSQVRQPPVG